MWARLRFQWYRVKLWWRFRKTKVTKADLDRLALGVDMQRLLGEKDAEFRARITRTVRGERHA